jgi:hypothetical protein
VHSHISTAQTSIRRSNSSSQKHRQTPKPCNPPGSATPIKEVHSPDRKKRRHNFGPPSSTRRSTTKLSSRRPPPPLARRHEAWKHPRLEPCHAAAMMHWWSSPPPVWANTKTQAKASSHTESMRPSKGKPHAGHPLAQQLTEINATHLENPHARIEGTPSSSPSHETNSAIKSRHLLWH